MIDARKEIAAEIKKREKFRYNELGEPLSKISSSSSFTSYKQMESTSALLTLTRASFCVGSDIKNC